VRSKVGLSALAVALCGAVLTLASCGQPVSLTHVELPSQLSWLHLTPTPPAPPASVFAQTLNGDGIEPGAWINQGQIDLGTAMPSDAAAPLAVEAEFEPEQQPLAGIANITGNPGQATVPSPQMDAGQTYHWAIRFRKPDGPASPWVEYPGTIGYQPTPPAAPVIQPLAHDGWVGTAKLQLSWHADTDAAGTAGFAYALDQDPSGALPARTDTATQSVSLTIPKDGAWYFHVRTLDNAGNSSDVATLPIHLDTVPLSLQPPKFELDGAWNPALGPLAVQVAASKAAPLTLAVLPETGNTPVRTMKLDGKTSATIQWDGKDDHGALVAPGNYRLRLTASDNTGRTAQALAQDAIPVTNKRIVVSLGQQRMWAFEGNKPILDTLVTSGGPELPTPVGTFHILSKMSPFTFHSPWPKGSPYWYADSPTNYAMLFESSGYFIHDAPWRSWYGPGSNTTDGTPGGNGTGTHGCVNVPLGVQAKLFAWTDVGTPVIVQP
jgi:lipoprotein-anchoring transpeptidase ErfK/SrfK